MSLSFTRLWLLPLLCLGALLLVEAQDDVIMGVSYEDVTGEGTVVRGCVEGEAKGEDGMKYCKKLTSDDTLKLRQKADDLVVLTIRRPGEEAFKRFLRSAHVYGYKVKVLGEEGEGAEEEVGGKRRIRLLQEALKEIKDEKEDRIVLYTESVDVILGAGPVRIVEELEELEERKAGGIGGGGGGVLAAAAAGKAAGGAESAGGIVESAGGPAGEVAEEVVKILVSADVTCWPDSTLERRYPVVEASSGGGDGGGGGGGGGRFLNSGGFLGRAGALYKLLKQEGNREIERLEKEEEEEEKKKKEGKKEGKKKEGKEEEEEEGKQRGKHALQNLFTRVYLDETLRKKHRIGIDYSYKVFQNLNGAEAVVEVRFAGREGFLLNTARGSVPIVIRGNGFAHLMLNTLSSYLARSWNPIDGCRACWENMIQLADNPEWTETETEERKERLRQEKEDQQTLQTHEEETKVAPVPKITLALFLERATPFLEEFLERIESLKYPKDKIDLYFHNSIDGHEALAMEWIERARKLYNSVKFIPAKENVKEWHARNQAIEECVGRECSHLFVVDSEAQLMNPYTLKLLIEQNRPVVAPLLVRPYKAWSNFWGAVTREGFYARSMDYMEIVQGQRRGLWNVPYVSGCYLIQRGVLESHKTRPSYVKNLLDPDMAFCETLREKGVFIHLSNRVEFGHLINNEDFNLERLNPELWEVERNRWDWERRYLNPSYPEVVSENTTVEMPCPDVFWFPVFTERFASEMIASFEDYGKWSDGGHMDPRLEGGYESVPTVDIHMKQMAMEEEWLEILRSYIQPMQLKVFQEYNNDVGPPRAVMNFMVRYRPDEQPFLRPHHDTSTYTINVALNRPGIDYEGGGCRFERYKCNVTDSRVGWVLMHPGRLTHLHEGLPTTKGTRYIIVSFVDP